MTDANHLPIALGSVGTIIGVAIVLAFQQPTTVPPRTGSDIDSLALSGTLSRLSTSIELLGDFRKDMPIAQTRPAERRPVDTSVSVGLIERLESMDRALVQLTESLSSLAQQGDSAGMPLVLAGRPVQTDLLQALDQTDDTTRALQHHRWSFQQALNAYGPPTSIDYLNGAPFPGSTRWEWDLPNGEEVRFYFINERLVSIET